MNHRLLLPALLLATGLAYAAPDPGSPATPPAKTAGPAALGFTRLRYAGVGWNDGQPAHQAAEQSLLAFAAKATGAKTEAPQVMSLADLRLSVATKPPALVYLTGSGELRLGQEDAVALRNFLTATNATLFADCGSPKWDTGFRAFAKLLFPSQPLQPIPADDPLCQAPCKLPNGPPPLWHHGGNRVLGINVQGRWVVIYHPGNLHDAWSIGHAGLDDATAKSAYEFGTNVLHYAVARRAGAPPPAAPPPANAKDNPTVPDGIALFDEAQISVVKSADLGATIAKLRADGKPPRTEVVAGRQFYRLEGTMIDTKWDATTPPLVILFGSKAYTQLLKRDKGISDALDENTDAIFVLKSGRVIRVCESGKELLTEAELAVLFPNP